MPGATCQKRHTCFRGRRQLHKQDRAVGAESCIATARPYPRSRGVRTLESTGDGERAAQSERGERACGQER